MNRRIRLVVIAGLILVTVMVFVVWRTKREGEFTPRSPLAPIQTIPTFGSSSPLSPPATPPLSPPLPNPKPANAGDSPLPVPPTGTPPVNTATLEAIRSMHPTATPPLASGSPWPYISPENWRRWALWILALAGVLAYIGLQLRQSR